MATREELKRRCKELGKSKDFINEFENSKRFNIALKDIQDVNNIKFISRGCRMLSDSIFTVHRKDCIIIMTSKQLKVYAGHIGMPDIFSIMFNQITSYKSTGDVLYIKTPSNSKEGDFGPGVYKIYIENEINKAMKVLNSILE